MLQESSPLKSLPTQLDRKQMLFLDGIRYSAEMAEIAYKRLQHTLAMIATMSDEPKARDKIYASALLDAWSVVDSLDRIRILFHQFPNSKDSKRINDSPVLHKIREVRNVTDHLGQKMDEVLSKKSSAMGMLTWCTFLEANKCIVCSFYSGTVGPLSKPGLNPAGKLLESPSGLISITAGGTTASLTDGYKEVSSLISQMETQLRTQVTDFCEANDIEEHVAGSNILLRYECIFS